MTVDAEIEATGHGMRAAAFRGLHSNRLHSNRLELEETRNGLPPRTIRESTAQAML